MEWGPRHRGQRAPLSHSTWGLRGRHGGAATTQPPTSELCGVPAAKRGVLCVQNRKKLRANRGKCPLTRQTTENNFFLFSAKQNRSGEQSPVPAFYTSGVTAAVQSRPKAVRSGGVFVVTQPAASPCTEGSPTGPLLTPANRPRGPSPSRKADQLGTLTTH